MESEGGITQWVSGKLLFVGHEISIVRDLREELVGIIKKWQD